MLVQKAADGNDIIVEFLSELPYFIFNRHFRIGNTHRDLLCVIIENSGAEGYLLRKNRYAAMPIPNINKPARACDGRK